MNLEPYGPVYLRMVMNSLKRRGSMAITAQLREWKNQRRIGLENQQYSFWKGLHEEYGKAVAREIRANFSPTHVITTVGETNHLLFPIYQQMSDVNSKLIYALSGKQLPKAARYCAEDLELIISGLRWIWNQYRKSKEPPPIVTSEIQLDENYLSEVHRQYFRDHSLVVSESVTGTVQRRIERVIADGAANGLTSRDVAQQIVNATGGQYSQWSALRLARSETNTLMNRVHLETMKGNSEFVETKIWMAMADKRVRAHHAEADGQEVPVDKPFIVGGSEMECPGDPAGGADEVANCRCDMVEGIAKQYLPDGMTYDQILGDLSTYIEEGGAIGTAAPAGEEAATRWTGPTINTAPFAKEIAEKNAAQWQMIADRTKSSVAEVRARVNAELKEKLKDCRVVSRVDFRTLFNKVLPEGRFKSQFESGQSGGLLDNKFRSKVEYGMFGYKANMAAKSRPIYGYLAESKDLFGASMTNLNGYGRVAVVFKRDIANRTTFCLADSFSGDIAPAKLLGADIADACAVNKAGYHLIRGENMAGANIRELSNYYSETQIHGGVSVSDIDSIIIPPGARLSKAEQDILKSHGISWSNAPDPE